MNKKTFNLMSKKELILMIEKLNKIQENNYNELKNQYEISIQNEEKWGAKRFGGKKSMEAFREGLLSGMVLLDPNLKSTVMKK